MTDIAAKMALRFGTILIQVKKEDLSDSQAERQLCEAAERYAEARIAVETAALKQQVADLEAEANRQDRLIRSLVFHRPTLLERLFGRITLADTVRVGQ